MAWNTWVIERDEFTSLTEKGITQQSSPQLQLTFKLTLLLIERESTMKKIAIVQESSAFLIKNVP